MFIEKVMDEFLVVISLVFVVVDIYGIEVFRLCNFIFFC